MVVDMLKQSYSLPDDQEAEKEKEKKLDQAHA